MRGMLSYGLCLLAFLPCCVVAGQEPWPRIERTVPPKGLALEPAVTQALTEQLERLEQRAKAVSHPLLPDVLILTKAVRYALELGEFYQPKDADKARDLLAEAERRLDALAGQSTPWTAQRGTVVRGFRSEVDGSVQPYGMVIPESLDLASPAPLYVWLHGRGDQTTDLHFVHQRMKQVGQIAPAAALVLHPFGRQCLGYKSAGQTDVLEAVDHVRRQYRIDPRRIVLIGFSMGGAGAWHLGAHFSDQWVAVSPGAGFAETARYQRLSPEAFPPWYEQKLWGMYDVPEYVRNLFNVPVLAYSGENDKQIQAARVMEEAYAAHGRQLTHLIGPGVEHKYEPATLKELLRRLDQHVQAGQNATPNQIFLQTRTLRYARQSWVEALGLEEHWRDSRIDARLEPEGRLQLTTTNIRTLAVQPPGPVRAIAVDGQNLTVDGHDAGERIVLVRDEEWRQVTESNVSGGLTKRPGLQGPIDDAFFEPFLVVRPTGRSRHAAVDRWVEFELEHFAERWRALFRGELRIKDDRDVTESDWNDYHVILFGDPQSNAALRHAMTAADDRHSLPLAWDAEQVRIGDHAFQAATHLPVLVYPNPLQPRKYIVINSGPTFREAHDRTNSLQNPKLPDWAVLNIESPPTASQAGTVVAADFFDEAWRVKTNSQR